MFFVEEECIMTENKHSWIKRGLTAGLFYLFAITPRLIGRPKRMPGKFYAHRGLHDLNLGIPENTMAAFRRAVEHGYGIELDIQLTKDGQVVAAHDFDLKRICGIEKDVDELTYEELKELPVLGTSEHIPLFQDVLDLVDGKVPLIVEIKYKNVGNPICRKAAEILDHYSGPYCIESFHPVALMWFRKYRPYIRRGQLGMNFHKDDGRIHPVYYFPRHLLTNCFTHPDFIAYDHHARSALSLTLCRVLFGMPCFAWTVKSPQELYACEHVFDYFIFEGFLPEDSDTRNYS